MGPIISHALPKAFSRRRGRELRQGAESSLAGFWNGLMEFGKLSLRFGVPARSVCVCVCVSLAFVRLWELSLYPLNESLVCLFLAFCPILPQVDALSF